MSNVENKVASYAIVGFGNIGQALARINARKGIEVSVATTRDPESFAAVAAAIGPTIIPATLAQAVKSDIIFLAVRFESHPDVAKELPNWQGKIIVDVTNAYGVPEEKMGGLSSAPFVARAFTGGKLVKGFNHLVAAVLDQDPPYMGAGESCSWRAMMTGQQRKSACLRKRSVFHQLILAGFRKVECLCRLTETAGVN
jgi:predicted dinucleotide-binding enzyme